jgi:hypothetical protein
VGPAANDTCDPGNDDNCNGSPNDGCVCVNTTTQPCGGVCDIQTCASGTWGACVPGTFATGDLHWPAPNAPGSGLPNEQQYDTSTPGIVLDKVTGLTWQQQVSALSYGPDEAAAYCTGLGGGWRLPAVVELLSIVDFTKSPVIDAAAFPGTPAEFFWTSTAVSGGPGRFWLVHFGAGVALNYPPGINGVPYANRVRCVR